MKPSDRNLLDSLQTLLNGRVCIVGVGNRHRGDDGAGPRLIATRQPGTRGVWLDAGIAPENYLEPIARTSPDAVLIVDAVCFGGCPGERRLIDADGLNATSVSTHAVSLSLLSEYLTARTGARVRILAIQPQTVDARDQLSQPVEESVRELACMLSDVL